MISKRDVRAFCLIWLIMACAGSAFAAWVWSPETGRWINPKYQPKETPELQLECANQLRLAGEYDKALAEYERFFTFYSDSELAPEAQFQIGEVYEALGKWERASEEYQKVIANWPTAEQFDAVIEKQYGLADRLYQRELTGRRWFPRLRGRYLRKAIRIYGQVIKNAPFGRAAAEAQYRIAECYYTLRKYLEATYEYRKVVDEYPASERAQEAAYGLAMCYYKQALPAEYDQTIANKAIEQFKLYVGLYPTDPKIQDAEAKVGELYEEMARQQLVVARFYERMRKPLSARVYYLTVTAKFPKTQAAAEAKEKLETSRKL